MDAITKIDLLEQIGNRIQAGQKTWVTTVYSEFLFAGLKDPKIMAILNQADFAVPDGIGIFWARKFLLTPLTAKNYWLKILQALWQIKYSLAAIIFYPKWIKTLDAEPSSAKASEGSRYNENKSWEKIVGADLIWDIAKKAAAQSLSIYLLGGFGETPKLVAEKLSKDINTGRRVYLSLNIAGYSSKNPDDSSIINDINQANPDILLVAFGPLKQEQWIFQNRGKLPSVKLFMGLGGTFDYIAGKQPSPPSLIRKIGLEWLWRLFTQPHRIKRIWNATFGLMVMLLRYKVFSSLGYRQNVVSVILKSKNQILIGKRSSIGRHLKDVGEYEKVKFQDYWQLPQGGVNAQEDTVDAAQRETFEELGIKNIRYLETSPQKKFYAWNTPLRPLWFNEYHFVGQEQSIVYFKFQGIDSEIKIAQEEFEKFRWVEIGDLDKRVHPERLSLAKIIQKDLKKMTEKGIIDK